jgi:superfamily II DNA or RNA helicase
MLTNVLHRNAHHYRELLAPASDLGGSSIERKSPLPHQQEAVRDLVKALCVPGSDVRTQANMACGSGKTMVALWVAEKLQAKKILLCEPSLALIAQTLKEWRANALGTRPDILVVCSDQTVVRPNRDEIKVDFSDLSAKVTSDPEEILRFLKNRSERKVLMSTYHSLHLVGQAMQKRGTGRFDLAIADEAHRTAAKKDGIFTLFHYQEVIRARARLYLTATPKIYQEDSKIAISMDDESIFGKVGHSLPFSKAIQRGLLADYRLVVATLPENYLGQTGALTLAEKREALAQLAFLKAAEKYQLSKVLTFHNSVARAYKFAESLEIHGPRFIPNKSIWAQAVDGRMPSSTRSKLLTMLAEKPSTELSLISNCRCLSEGVDVPAIDGVVFFDPRSDSIDIVQAIGRAIRRSTSTKKEFGTIIVPVVVPESVKNAEFLGDSEFKHIAQVMRALRAHDDRFEVRIKAVLSGDPESNHHNSRPRPEKLVDLDVSDLPTELLHILSAKVLRVGAGLLATPLSEDLIIKAAIAHYEDHGHWPSCETKQRPRLLPNDTWGALNAAGRLGLRNLPKGRTLAKILAPIKAEFGFKVLGTRGLLSEKIILKAAEHHYQETGKWPSAITPGRIPLLPDDTWKSIDGAGHSGSRGLGRGRTLARILRPLKVKNGSPVARRGGPLSEEKIILAAIDHKKKHGKWPTSETKDKIPSLPNDTWRAINLAGSIGLRNLKKGRTLSTILAPIKEKYPDESAKRQLHEDLIIQAAIEHYEAKGKWPSQLTKGVIRLLPDETWSGIQSAGADGRRNLVKGRTLSVILAPVKERFKAAKNKK